MFSHIGRVGGGGGMEEYILLNGEDLLKFWDFKNKIFIQFNIQIMV